MDKHCDNLIKFFNDAYDNYKSKSRKHNISNCIKKIHSHKVDEIKLGLPRKRSCNINIDKDDKIYIPLSFILSNLNQKQFTDREENKYAFNALMLILNILEDHEIINSQGKPKKLLSNVKLNNELLNKTQFGKYRIVIPKKEEFIFTVTGLDLATLKINKLYRINTNKLKRQKNKISSRRIKKSSKK